MTRPRNPQHRSKSLQKQIPRKPWLRLSAAALVTILFFSVSIGAQAPGPTARTAQYFDSVRNSPSKLFAFLLQMPKGGDLHNHLSGAIYAESYIQWAAAGGNCVSTTTWAASLPPCTTGQVPIANALTSSVLFQQIIDAWSMRNWQLSGESGHDHFFNTFSKFGVATYNNNGKMLAEAVTRAAHGNVMYLELMLTPDGTPTGVLSSQIGNKVGWDGNPAGTLSKLKTNGIDAAVPLAIKNLNDAEAEKDSILKCGTPHADPGCKVVIRYIAQVSRGSALGPVFAQMVTGFALANDPNSKVVALNLVQAEDGAASMQNFSVHMQMLQFLRPMYPRAHLSLHAGELVPGIVPSEGLTFHIRDSVTMAQANRIGHGVDIMHEKDAVALMRKMARGNVMVEICLSSNDSILGVSGPRHPLATYLKYGVPVALATDDEGVSRSEISREYLRAVQDQGLGYMRLKMMARNSLQYAFISGASLWSDARKFVAVSQCTQDVAMMKLSSNDCQQYVIGSEKAKLQWQLEEQFREFERER
jgi:adenosine deaminase